MSVTDDQIAGCLLGTAVGDALGLPYEGLSRRRAQRLLGAPDRYRLLFGSGLVSDDTEHACLVAQALVASAGDRSRFASELAARLRRWFLLLPPGVGLATARACVRLCLGYGAARSGVRSAGNGPAMRAPLLGVMSDDVSQLRGWITVSSRITHSDPQAECGAFLIALAAHLAARESLLTPQVMWSHAVRWEREREFAESLRRLDLVIASVEQHESTLAFADRIGLSNGVGGFIHETVPVALHAVLSHPAELMTAIQVAIACGGDTDSVAAIVGGIVGARVGRQGIDPRWLNRLVDWPQTVDWMSLLAAQAGRVCRTGIAEPPLQPAAWQQLTRNLALLAVVLAHGFRRLAPPW